MKKILVTLAIALIGSLTMTTVEAADITVAASDDLSQKIEGAASGDILLLEEGTYIGNITIDKDLTIKGENKETTIIEGQITVKNNLNLEGVTVVGKYVDNTYRNVVTITVPELTVDITNCILNVEGYVDGEDYKTGVAGVRVDRGSDSTQLTIKDTEIKVLLKIALTDKINDRTVYMKGIDASYYYEGYYTYTIEEIDNND